jgi:hypothetical protein
METKFITSRVKHNHTFYTGWSYTVESAEIPEALKFDRWYKAFGDKIIAVRRVTVQQEMSLNGEMPNFNTHFCPKETYLEVETATAIACIVEFVSGSDVQGVIVKGGRKAKSHTLGTWRKYGCKRGHGMAWLRAKQGLKQCTSPESGSDICPGRAYEMLGSANAWAA